MTKAADNERFVRLYQEKHGLARDGHAGAKTFASLGYSPPTAAQPQTRLSTRGLLELISHEAIVLEAYKDSKGIWTWGIGVTDVSGHSVGRYKDNPQTVQKCLEIFLWLLNKKYLPETLAAFQGRALTEEQLAAAVSFHWNTGAIGRATWVKDWLAGDIQKARAGFMQWRIPAEIKKRREKEFDLFFGGMWSNDGKSNVIPVNRKTYAPIFSQTVRIDVRKDVEALNL